MKTVHLLTTYWADEFKVGFADFEEFVVSNRIIIDGSIKQLSVHLPSEIISYFTC